MSQSMKSRSRRRLYIALVLGLIAATVTYAYVDFSTRKPVPKTAMVVVARADIPAKTRLTADMLTTQEVPLETKLPSALTSTEQAQGKVIAVPLTKGEQVLSTKFQAESPERLSLSTLIPPGKRAVAVTFGEIIGTGGLIVPGDYVDVIAIFDTGTMGKDEATIILQNIQVLAVAQALEGEEEMPVEGKTAAASPPKAAGSPSSSSSGTGAQNPAPEKATARPTAKSATLAVTPEQAQRLVLAEAKGKLRFALRPVKDATTVDLPEATLSKIKEPLEAAQAVITAAEISPTNVKPGDVITVKATVRNTSNVPLHTQAPDPKTVYVQGQTYYSQGFASEPGKYRIGVNFAGQSTAPYPYRWGLGGDLAPGASTTIEGQIKIAYDFQPMNFWVGLIREPADVLQDSFGVTLVTALPANVAVVAVDVANVRSGPSISSSIVSHLAYGKEVPILGQQDDWYKIRLEDGRDGWVAAGWIVAAAR